DHGEEAGARLGLVGGAAVAQQLGRAADAGQRRLELVADVGRERARVVRAALQLVGHGGDRARELSDLVGAPDQRVVAVDRLARAALTSRRRAIGTGRGTSARWLGASPRSKYGTGASAPSGGPRRCESATTAPCSSSSRMRVRVSRAASSSIAWRSPSAASP